MPVFVLLPNVGGQVCEFSWRREKGLPVFRSAGQQHSVSGLLYLFRSPVMSLEGGDDASLLFSGRERFAYIPRKNWVGSYLYEKVGFLIQQRVYCLLEPHRMSNIVP